MWWIEVYYDGRPFTPCKPAMQSEAKPRGYYRGPFHCAECANTCVSFGKTEKQAHEFCHGTDDEKFCTFLAIQ
jgi:hypothetical protein